ncbi:MAG: 2-oxoisovalerate dehydrogenase [Prolixibacteraceae bacterium]|jgi:2-oxoisovalerate dehydrogenase E1 component|nr:2-oxoisovalerate dehydrogenase [Prolixibacteraceae bacterium]MBT7000701.1 2-oxoisovalerate dehydrogenase [Prolixibacteraceae bacterium]MBT7393615.1 2-oxoisovalerate dehydrogenase [Prolixibacteraceae bacterium]
MKNLEVPKIYSIKKTPKELLEKWFGLMTIGRAIDEKAPNYLKQAIGWSYHAPYAGHDGIQLAVGQHFEKNIDHIFLYYREMLTALSCGITPEEIILNGISKANDPSSGGRHMSNHFAKPEWNIHSVSSSTGNHTLHAVGVARAIKYYGEKSVAISGQGESSVSEGYVYEAISGADKEKLPVIFVIQDNGYGISVPKKDQTANRKVANNFTGFKNTRIIHCNGKDVFDSMNAMAEAKRYAIEESKPVILQANCVRMGSHSNSDDHLLYRSQAERNYVEEYDPLAKFRRLLIRYKRFTEEEIVALEESAKTELKAAHKAALKAPDPTPESIYDFVIPEPHKSKKYSEGLHNQDGENKKLITALNETLKAEFKYNPDTFIWGQDMANKDKGGIFNVSKGMQQEFGEKRVFNAPIAEDFIMGTANGMSRYNEKIRIVIEGAEFADYFWPAMEQYVDSSHDFWRSNGKFSPNVTVRLASGGYIGGGMYHSQNIEGSLVSIPGVRIVYPSFADDAAGLLRTAMRSKGMTMFMEPKALYNDPKAATSIPDDFEVPFGKARIRKEGTDITLLTYGNTTHLSLEAAKKLQDEGVSIELIDLRSLVPLDEETIIESVKKTNKVLVVHEDKIHGGFGGELSAIITEKAFEYLDAPVKRVGSTFTPVGFNRILEKAILPNAERIYNAAKELIEY